MQAHDMRGEVAIDVFIAFVEHDEEQIESTPRQNIYPIPK
jgi:hypothetical protein